MAAYAPEPNGGATGGAFTPDPAEVAGKIFPKALRGLDPDAVRRYLVELAERLKDAKRAETAMRNELDELRRAAAVEPERPTNDEALSSAIGAETGRVLAAAHDAARDIVANAERRVASMLLEAETAAAERMRTAEADAAEILARARTDVAARVEQAREQCREMIDEARDARRRILADLVDRRHALHVQLEQLRAGRDSLAEMVDAVSGTVLASVQAVKVRIEQAEEHARLAALDAGQEADIQDEGPDLETVVSDALARLPAAVAPSRVPAGTGQSDSAAEGVEQPPAGTGSPFSPSGAEAAVPDVESVEATETVESAPGVTPPTPTPEESAEPAAAPAPDSSEGAEESAGTNPIDELFARIRANREEEVERARGVLGGRDAHEAPLGEVGSAATAAHGAQAEDEDAGSDSGPFDAAQSVVELPTDPVLSRRDELVAPAIGELARSLKRALRLEQNDLLDALRNLKKGTDRSSFLPGDAMAERLASASTPALEMAYRAGLTFARGDVERAGSSDTTDGPVPAAAVADIASALGRDLVEPIRRRVDAGLDVGGDEQDSGGVVGSAFKDWRGSRAEGVAGDFVARAFAQGTVDWAAERAVDVRWFVDDGDSRCPDCDDNALAGAVPAGEPFPTGHLAPPIHPGCRCLLVPSSS